MSVLSLLLANLVTIGFAFWQSWRLIDVLWIYGVQSLIMTLFTWRRTLNLKQFSTGGMLVNNQPVEPTEKTKKMLAWYFLFFFGPVHLIFLLFLTGANEPALGMRDIGFAVCILAFAVNHVFSYFHHRQEDINGTPNVAAFWVCPGLRLFPMFLALKTVLPVSGSGISLLQFLILQTTVDVIMHMVQHSNMKAKT